MSENGLSDEQLEAVRAALFRGQKIEAIKLYREATGEGLKEAKEAVESLEAGEPPAGAGPAVKRPEVVKAKGGCFSLVVLSGMVGGVLVWAAGRGL